MEGMRFADPVNIGHSVPALMDTLETRWMKRSVAKRNCVPTTKTAQETEYAKNTDVLHHWNVSIPNNTVHLYEFQNGYISFWVIIVYRYLFSSTLLGRHQLQI